MTRVNKSYKSLLQGVSQQPSAERIPGQHGLQENWWPSPQEGFTRRPPTTRKGTLFSSTAGTQWRLFGAKGGNRYVSAFLNGDVRVFDFEGVEQTVTVDANAQAYLDGTELKTAHVNGKQYVLNTGKVVAQLSNSTDFMSKEGRKIYFVKNVDYPVSFKLRVEWYSPAILGNKWHIFTDNATAAGQGEEHVAQGIATEMGNDAGDAVDFRLNFDYVQAGKSILVQWKSLPNSLDFFEMESQDDHADDLAYIVEDTVKDPDFLPDFAPHGWTVKVEGDAVSADDYYLQYFIPGGVAGEGFGQEGVWLETTAPGENYQWDTATLPHTLERQDNGTFRFARAPWDDRGAGGNDSNPPPKFLGETITDLSAFQGRLVMLSNEYWHGSTNNKPTNFWKNSATTGVDDDPIEITSTDAGSDVVMQKAVPYNKNMIVYSDGAQFFISGADKLTPDNAAMVFTSAFETDLGADPVVNKRHVYFPFKYGQHSGVYEFETDGLTEQNDADDITAHVDAYIPANPIQIVISNTAGIMLLRSANELNAVYAYNFRWSKSRGKVQSAWHKWTFVDDVEFMSLDSDTLTMVMDDGTDFYMQAMTMNTTSTPGVGYNLNLDNLMTAVATGDTVTAPGPYAAKAKADFVAVQGAGCPNPGQLAYVDDKSGATITLLEDMTGGTIWFGQRYLSRVQPTRPYTLDRDGEVVTTGELTIGRLHASLEDTGALVARVSSPHYPDVDIHYEPSHVGHHDTLLGDVTINDDVFEVPIEEHANNYTVEFRSDSHLPCKITLLEWSGQYVNRQRRL